MPNVWRLSGVTSNNFGSDTGRLATVVDTDRDSKEAAHPVEQILIERWLETGFRGGIQIDYSYPTGGVVQPSQEFCKKLGGDSRSIRKIVSAVRGKHALSGMQTATNQ